MELNPEEIHARNADFWDDYEILFPDYLSQPIEKANEFTSKRVQTETLWLATPFKEIEMHKGGETIGKLPYIAPYRKILFHNKKHIVGVYHTAEPSSTSTKERIVEAKENLPEVRWPPRPSSVVMKQWQTEGIHTTLATYNEQTKSTIFKEPLLFQTFNTINEDNTVDEPVFENPLEHPKSKAILNRLKIRDPSKRPPMHKAGKMMVGTFASPTSNQIHWNDETTTGYPFHVQCAGIAEPGWEFLMVCIVNKRLEIWDLSTPDIGPIFTIVLDHDRCSTKAIIDLVVTTDYIAFLDGNLLLTIIPINWAVLRMIHSTKETRFTNAVEISTFLKEKGLVMVELNLMSTFWVPTAFALGANVSSPKVLYLGTQHGYLHEMSFVHPRKDGNVTLTQDYTYCLSMPGPVQFIQGRANKVICGTDHNAYLFGKSISDPSENIFRIETGSGFLTDIRNVQFQGNLILIETNNRHILLYHTLTGKQRVLPSSLGSKILQSVQEESEKRLREATSSLIYWNNEESLIRIAYGLLTTETWHLPLPNSCVKKQ